MPALARLATCIVGRMNVLVRSITPAVLLLALLLFLFLPVVGASCGESDGGPAHLCYTGGQLVTGEPDLDMSDILAGDERQTAELRDGLVNTVDLTTAATVLALVTGVAVALGIVVAALPGARPRATVAAVVAGVILATTTEIVAITGLTTGVSFLTNIFGAFDSSDPDTIVSTELGFWLTLAALVVAFVAALARRNAATDLAD